MATPTTTSGNGSPAYSIDALQTFAQSHAGILERLERLRQLAKRYADGGTDPELRSEAQTLYRFFNGTVLAHHDEEEEELFPVLKQCAERGDEAGLVDSIVARLEHEHRHLETAWDHLEPALRRIGRGKPAQLDTAAVDRFATAYAAHATFEEKAVLPLAEKILRIGGHAALAMRLAIRRNPPRGLAYI